MKTPCNHIQTQLIDLLLGQLDRQQEKTVKLHLDSCSVCQSYFEQLRNQEKELEHMGTQITNNLEEKQEKVINALNTLPHRAPQPDRRIWSLIMYSKRIRYIAAAIVLVAVSLSLVYWQGNKEIQIPPELAQMPVEELIKIHKGDVKSPYDSIVVKAALENALNNMPAREIIALADKTLINLPVSRFSKERAQRIYSPPRPVTETIEAADVLIYGRVDKVEIDVSDLKKALLREEYARLFQKEEDFDYSQRVPEEVQVEVYSVYPPNAVSTDRKLLLQQVVSTSNLDLLQESQNYLLLLKKDDERIWMLPSQQGVYPVDTEKEILAGFRSDPIPVDQVGIPLELAWSLMTDSYQVIHEEKEPSTDILEYWTAELQSNIFVDSWLALDYFSTLRNVPDIGDVIVSGIEKYHVTVINNPDGNSEPIRYNFFEIVQRITYVTEALDLLMYMNDRQSIDKVILLSQENQGTDSVFNPSVGDNHHSRILQNKLVEAARQESTEIPVTPESQDIQPMDYKRIINEAIDKYQQDPSESYLNDVFNAMYEYLRPEDKEYIPFLQEHVTSHWMALPLITRLADPAFVPVLQECLKKEVKVDFLETLFACGEYLTAIDTGINELLTSVEAEDLGQFEKELNRRAPIIRFLGMCGDITALPAIEYYLDEDFLNSLYEAQSLLDGRNPACVEQLQRNAVLALALLEGETAIPKLKKIYESGDIHIRILAAVSLFSLGDDTGHELIEPFAKNTHRNIPEIEERWQYELEGVFQSSMMYLESPRIDTLMLEKMQNGIEYYDRQYVCMQSFVDTYESQILRILLDQLSSKDRETRRYAYDILKNITGKDFPFNPAKFSGQQDDAIGVWRNYVEQYLKEKSPPD